MSKYEECWPNIVKLSENVKDHVYAHIYTPLYLRSYKEYVMNGRFLKVETFTLYQGLSITFLSILYTIVSVHAQA